jgi:catechol 2,3-dioxygenase-like lactoylglutathione lyase family enzyme
LLGASTQRIEIIHFSEPAVVAREGSGVSTTGLSHLTVVVDNDVAAAVSELEAAGAEPVVTKGAAGEAVVFQDPDGNLIRGVPVPPPWSRAD